MYGILIENFAIIHLARGLWHCSLAKGMFLAVGLICTKVNKACFNSKLFKTWLLSEKLFN